MTLGDDIFLKDRFDAASRRSRDLLVHELIPTVQVYRFGNKADFGCEYCKGFARADFSYRNNSLEVEAYDLTVNSSAIGLHKGSDR